MAHKDKEKLYYVYIHTTPNGKRYVGLTHFQPGKRWRNGKNYKSSRYFYNAIQKYGWENIKHEVLYSGLTWNEASKEEKRLIALYKTNDANYGYNCTSGGEDGFHHDKKTIYKISESSKRMWEDPNRAQINILSNKKRWAKTGEKEKLSQLSKERWKSERYRLKLKAARDRYNNEHKAEQSDRAKRMWSNPEFRNKMSDRFSGGNNPSARKVCQYTLDGTFIKEYDCCKEAAAQNGLKSYSNICACANGRVKTSGGYVWRYRDGL